jgi:hypothetical protein
MDGTRNRALLRRCWLRLLDGDRRWGSVDVQPDRFGVTRYRLVVYPPGINDTERRWVRIWRGWPFWGVLVWIVCEIGFSEVTGPSLAFCASTAAFLASGAVAAVMAGDARAQVRTMTAMVMVGVHDPLSRAIRDRLESLAAILLEADDRLEQGLISPSQHELAWWRVYRTMAPDAAARTDSAR